MDVGKDGMPLLGSPASCPMRHTGYCIAGEFVVRMIKTNAETRMAMMFMSMALRASS